MGMTAAERALAQVTMSGEEPRPWHDQIMPVRPKPPMTSLAMVSTPWRRNTGRIAGK